MLCIYLLFSFGVFLGSYPLLFVQKLTYLLKQWMYLSSAIFSDPDNKELFWSQLMSFIEQK